ncbi:hypothetical protein PRIPAC_74050 [Pristionchus pacificus]|uniref:Uncharacterized protein n=1 Tax=Pristionchus pacificus TaxID=54126 RepID=A0A2A6B5A4_PRIPA|nr:hypothetical protein PRIPAC_74050 [Pristionchus pacificus]|eukprot:PDM61054.1 hypothetical protein PRIPAC_54860 [Pristionchus pacificus]
MRSSLLFLFLPLNLLALDLNDVNDKALENETKARQEEHKLDCIKDIGVTPLDELRHVKPYYQIFILDLTAPMETFARIRLLFVQAVCLYAAHSNHIRIGYIALVNKHKVSSEPSIPDIREFIGMWTEPDEKLLNGVAKARQDTPLTHCEKAELLGHIINRFKRMTAKPFRFLIIDDQKSDDQTNINCDQAYEFGKALHRRNISLDNFILDEVVSRDPDHSSGRRMTKTPIFTMSSLDDTEAFMGGMKTYVETLQKPEAWSSEALKSMILQNEMVLDDEEDYDDANATEHVIIEFTHDNFTLGSEENMTNPHFHEEEEEEVGRKVAASPKRAVIRNTTSSSPSSTTTSLIAVASQAVVGDAATTEYPTSTTNATDATMVAAGRGMEWWIWLLIIIIVLIILFILFIIFCCWYDKRKLKTKLDKGSNNSSVTPSLSNNQTTPLIGPSSRKGEPSSGSSSKRPLRLTKSNHVAESTPEAGTVLVEKNLPDPYSPVKYMNTPVPMPSEIEMTHTEHVAPPTMDEALNKHVVTPMEKVPELHIDDYNI